MPSTEQDPAHRNGANAGAWRSPRAIFISLRTQLISGLIFALPIAITFWIVAQIHAIGLSVDGFGSAFWAALILAIVSFILSHIVKEVDKGRQTTP